MRKAAQLGGFYLKQFDNNDTAPNGFERFHLKNETIAAESEIIPIS